MFRYRSNRGVIENKAASGRQIGFLAVNNAFFSGQFSKTTRYGTSARCILIKGVERKAVKEDTSALSTNNACFSDARGISARLERVIQFIPPYVFRVLLPAASEASSSSPTSPRGFADFTFTKEPQDTVTVRGGVLRLDCQARSDTASGTPSVTWRKDGVLLGALVDERRQELANGSLIVHNIVHSRHHRPDEGEYQCLSTLEGLGSIVSRTARVTVAGKMRRVWAPPGICSISKKKTKKGGTQQQPNSTFIFRTRDQIH